MSPSQAAVIGATAERAAASRPQRVGIVIEAPRSNPTRWSGALENPRAVAVRDTFLWSEFEPYDATYDWSPLEEALDDCTANGKRLVIQMSFSGDVSTGNHCPPWAINGLNRYILHADSDGSAKRFPMVWRDPMRARIKSFIRDFGAAYGLDERIEMIQTAGWQTGTNEPAVNDPRDFTDFVEVLEPLGIPMNPGHAETALTGDDEWSQSIIEDGGFLDVWDESFPGVRLGATIKFAQGNDPDNGFYEAFIDKLVSIGGWELLNTGLNEGDKTSNLSTASGWRASGSFFGWSGTSGPGSHSSLTGRSLWYTICQQAVGNGDVTSRVVLNQATASQNALAYPDALDVLDVGLVA